MKFSNRHNEYFDSKKGAFSVVTERENFDSQLTFTDTEAEIVLNFFGEANITRGGVKNDPELSSKKFKKFDTNEDIYLNVVYPKENKTELRLYLSEKAGFKPPAGDIWFIYLKDNDLHIGHMSQADWDNLQPLEGIGRTDETDNFYQNTIHSINEIEIITLGSRDVYKRNRLLAIERMKASDYTCDVNMHHELFISRFTGKPYLEAHHLIPLGTNELFDKSLDTLDNIFCLCPNCHRAIHHAEETLAKELINNLSDKNNVLNIFSLDKEDLYYLYSI